MSPERKALLIVDHGSRVPETNARLASLANEVARRRPEWIVAHAHMELSQPDVPSAIDALVEAGAAAVHVHLHFLSAGMHVQETIPELIEAARSRHDRIEITVGEPLGHDPRMADLVVDGFDARPDGS